MIEEEDGITLIDFKTDTIEGNSQADSNKRNQF